MERELKVVRIFKGARESVQVGPFTSALARHPHRSLYKIEFLTTADIKVKLWHIKDMVGWMLPASVYILLNHPNQGNHSWDCRETPGELSLLEEHVGFPDKLSCPNFLQNKIRLYLHMFKRCLKGQLSY